MWDSERAQMLVDAQVGQRKHRQSCLLLYEGDNLLTHSRTEVPGVGPASNCHPFLGVVASTQKGYVTLYENITGKAQELVSSMSEEVMSS